MQVGRTIENDLLEVGIGQYAVAGGQKSNIPEVYAALV